MDLATGLSYFEEGYLTGHPYGRLDRELEQKCAEASDDILAFVRLHPEVLENPYGFPIDDGKSILKQTGPRVSARNILAKELVRLGFGEFEEQVINAFYEWVGEAESRIFQTKSDAEKREAEDQSRKNYFKWQRGEYSPPPQKSVRERYLELDSSIQRWAFLNALSCLGLFIVHVRNIYEADKGVITNLYAANIREDALGRTNYQPSLAAIAKIVRKNLGWRSVGGSSEEEKRASLLIALVEHSVRMSGIAANASPGIEFERQCIALLEKSGFAVRATRMTGDFGADLIAEKDDLSYAIQCKSLSKPVGIKAIQEVIGARRHYGVDFACVCADSGFTDAAIELAASNHVMTSSLSNLPRTLDIAR